MYKIDEFWLKNRQIGAFWTKSMKISLEITKLLPFGLQNGDYYDFLVISIYLCMYELIPWQPSYCGIKNQIRFQIINQLGQQK